MFKSFGWPEIVIILVIVLIIFGVGKLPQIGGAIGKSIKEFRKSKSGDDSETENKDDKNVAKSTTSEPKEKS
jgi:sec-independent protein translocase protein TatA